MSARIYHKLKKYGTLPNKKIGSPNEFHLFERDERIIFIDKHSETELQLREVGFQSESKGTFKETGRTLVVS